MQINTTGKHSFTITVSGNDTATTKDTTPRIAPARPSEATGAETGVDTLTANDRQHLKALIELKMVLDDFAPYVASLEAVKVGGEYPADCRAIYQFGHFVDRAKELSRRITEVQLGIVEGRLGPSTAMRNEVTGYFKEFFRGLNTGEFIIDYHPSDGLYFSRSTYIDGLLRSKSYVATELQARVLRDLQTKLPQMLGQSWAESV